MAIDHAISIVIPCYNDGEYLNRSAESALSQLQAGDELIVVDDGSTDCTADIADRLRKSQPCHQVRYHYKPNGGVSSARNAGTRIANSEFLLFLDADDELLPGALTAFRASFDPETDLYIGGHQWKVNDRISERQPRVDPSDRSHNFNAFITKRLHVGNLSCMCVRKSVFDELAFPTSLVVGEDQAFLLLVFATRNVRSIDTPVACVHRRAGSLRERDNKLNGLESPVAKIVFEHAALPMEFQRFRRTAQLQHLLSLLRMYWKARHPEAYQVAFRALVQMSWRFWLSKWAIRFVLFRSSKGRRS